MINIGDRVRVNQNNKVYDDFFGATGTVTKEFITIIGVRKLVVRFDEPLFIDDPFSNDWDISHDIFHNYDFMENCLDLLED